METKNQNCTNTKLKKMPLHDWHMAHGADLQWGDDCYPWAYHQCGDIEVEYESIRTGTGLLDLFSIFSYMVTGAEAEKFIQHTFTNTVRTMTDGQLRYGTFVDANGIMMDEGNILRFNQEKFMIMVNAPYLEAQLRELCKGINAELVNVTDDFGKISVQGPSSMKALQNITERDLSDLKYFKFWTEETTIAGCKGLIARCGYSGEKGYEIYIDPKNSVTVWEALIAEGGEPYGVTALDIARPETGQLLLTYDFELDEFSPYDLSLDKFIKDEPDCIGNEALLKYGANPPKRFITLRIEGDKIPKMFSPIIKDGLCVGEVKTPSLSPRLGSIAMAMISTEVSEEGTVLQVIIGDELVNAKVGPMSPLDPQKLKPRT